MFQSRIPEKYINNFEDYMDGEGYLDKSGIFINSCRVEESTSYHAHNFIEIAYVAAGEGEHKVGSKNYPCSQGDIYILNYDVSHKFIPADGKFMIINNCIFRPNFIDYRLIDSRNFEDISGHYLLSHMIGNDFTDEMKISLPTKQKIYVDNLYSRMLEELETKEEGYVEILRAYLIELLIILFRVFKKKIISSNMESKQMFRNDAIFKNIMTYIETNLYKDIKLDDVSILTFFSPIHFSRMFKTHTGMTLKEYVQNSRIDEACRLLETTDKKVIEIAEDVGYHDIKHFNMLFKRRKGKTPSEYRRGG
jgi:AraC family L-rhamnose operon transcriptional activator RhaR